MPAVVKIAQKEYPSNDSLATAARAYFALYQPTPAAPGLATMPAGRLNLLQLTRQQRAELIVELLAQMEAEQRAEIRTNIRPRRNLQASRIDPSDLSNIAAVPGVAAAAPIGELTLTVEVGGEPTDLSLWGVDLNGPGRPEPIVEGRLPDRGEVVVDKSGSPRGSKSERPSRSCRAARNRDRRLCEGSSLAVVATGYVGFDEWAGIFKAEFPGTPVVPSQWLGLKRGPAKIRPPSATASPTQWPEWRAWIERRRQPRLRAWTRSARASP